MILKTIINLTHIYSFNLFEKYLLGTYYEWDAGKINETLVMGRIDSLHLMQSLPHGPER